MKIKFILLLSIFAILGVLAFTPKCNYFYNGTTTLKKVGSIELPGKTGKRFDYLTIDYKHNYLFSAHLGADVLYVIDLKTDKLLKMITNTPGAEGVEYVEELNKVYTSNWGDHTVGVIDMNQNPTEMFMLPILKNSTCRTSVEKHFL
jgi:hypothetical protein